MFRAFQRWFRIENRSIIKEIKPILDSRDNIGSPKLRGASLLLFTGRRSNGSAVRAQTNGRTDRQTERRTLPSALSPSLRGR